MRDQLEGRRPFQFSLRTFLIVITAIPALIWACDRSVMRIEDGDLDVEMRYQAIDLETGSPISGATVEIADGENTTKPLGPPLRTDVGGFASRICKDSMCSWHVSNLGFTNKFYAGGAVPWAARLSAAGYERTDWIWAGSKNREWNAEYLGNHKGRVTIRVPLRPSGEATSK